MMTRLCKWNSKFLRETKWEFERYKAYNRRVKGIVRILQQFFSIQQLLWLNNIKRRKKGEKTHNISSLLLLQRFARIQKSDFAFLGDYNHPNLSTSICFVTIGLLFQIYVKIVNLIMEYLLKNFCGENLSQLQRFLFLGIRA